MNQVHLLKYIPQNLLINKPNLSLHLYNERENVINWGYYSFWYWLLFFHIKQLHFSLIHALVVNIYWAFFRLIKINSLKMKQKYNGFCIIKFGFKISKCVIKLLSLDNFIKYTSLISEELNIRISPKTSQYNCIRLVLFLTYMKTFGKISWAQPIHMIVTFIKSSIKSLFSQKCCSLSSMRFDKIFANVISQKLFEIRGMF